MTNLNNSPLAHFFDDAAVFPPGSAPLDVAVHQHLERRGTALITLTGPLLLPIQEVAKAQHLATQVADEFHIDLSATPLQIGLIVPAGDLSAALDLIENTPAGLQFTGIEQKTTEGSWPGELEELQQANTALPRFAEFNSVQVAEGAITALQGGDVHLKVRTGGLQADLFPSPLELGTIITKAVQNRVPFKLTAGLHRALRHTNPETGFTHHGFLNIAVATHAAATGANAHTVTEFLALTDPEQLTDHIRAIPVQAWRQRFLSFGTCSISEPLESLEELGLDIAAFTDFGAVAR